MCCRNGAVKGHCARSHKNKRCSSSTTESSRVRQIDKAVSKSKLEKSIESSELKINQQAQKSLARYFDDPKPNRQKKNSFKLTQATYK